MLLIKCVLFDPGPAYAHYTARAIQRQHRARAQGTNLNMKVAVKHYVNFCNIFEVTPSHPSVQDLCVLVEYLADFLKSPGSIINYISLLKRHARQSMDSMTPWLSFRLALALDAVTRDKSHIPCQRPPLHPDLLYRAFKFLAPPPRLSHSASRTGDHIPVRSETR